MLGRKKEEDLGLYIPLGTLCGAALTHTQRNLLGIPPGGKLVYMVWASRVLRIHQNLRHKASKDTVKLESGSHHRHALRLW